MDNLSSIATTPGRGSRLYRGLIAEDAIGPNDTVPVRIELYDPTRQFGPCHWSPRTLADGSPMYPMRNDECLVALDENDQAEIVNWWADDPTSATDRVTQTEYDALAGRVTNLEKWTQPARLDYGPSSQSGSFTTAIEMLHGVTGNPQRFVITPAFDAWIEVGYHTIAALAADTGWSRIDSYISVDPSPPVLPGQINPNTGLTWGHDVKYAHVATGWVGIESRTWVPLTAGVTYTITSSLIPQVGTSWVYYRGEFSWFEHGGLRRRT